MLNPTIVELGDVVSDRGLLDLGMLLKQRNYAFVQPSVSEVRRQRRRPAEVADALPRLFGWGMEVGLGEIDRTLREAIGAAGVLHADRQQGVCAASIRCATVRGALCFHTAGPGAAQDAVFIGPDTYHFIDVLERELAGRSGISAILEVGCGSGAASIWLAQRFPHAHVVACDINPAALRLADINRRLAGVDNLSFVLSDVLAGVQGEFDLVVSNPPFIADSAGRIYRDGGGLLGMALPLRIIDEAHARLRQHGTVLMYTVSPIVRGRHVLADQLQARAIGHAIHVLDPDVYRDLHALPAYQGVESICAVLVAVPARARQTGAGRL